MKNMMSRLILIAVMLDTLSAAHASDADKATMKNQMIIRIGSKTFTARLSENQTASAFKAMLPLTVNMADLNDNEKVVPLSANLPTNDSIPKQIQAGDLMVWNSRSLVLFYKTFPTSYSYTRVGRIDDASGLFAAVGSGNVTVTFELQPGKGSTEAAEEAKRQ